MSERNSACGSRTNDVRGIPRPDSITGLDLDNVMETVPLPLPVGVAAASRSRSTSRTVKTRSLTNPSGMSPDGAEISTNPSPTEIVKDAEAEIFECAICLQTCVHPVRLPCSHIFCFLCIKGVAIQSKRCALCRQDIPVEFCNDPALLRKEDLLKELWFEDGYQWYYQGMNGWWQYDERASKDIEEHYNKGEKTLEMLIAGFLYIVDFENMLQYRRNDPTRRRKIKRDLVSIPDKKGVAGLKITSPISVSPHRLEGDGGENVPCVVQRGLSSINPARNRQSPPLAVTSPNTPYTTPEGYSTDSPNHDQTQDLTFTLASLSLRSELTPARGRARPSMQTSAVCPPTYDDDNDWE